MKVYLVRHAIAHERNRTRWPKDAARPLTAAGKQKFRKTARGLARLLPKSALLLTSPFVRARDTALILASVAKLLVGSVRLAHKASPLSRTSLAVPA